MASSGQILNILNALGKGAGEVQRGERRARQEEGKQHRKLFQEAGVRGAKASRKAKKGEKWGSILSTLVGLTGAGIPLMVAAQLAGSYLGGKAGAKKGRKGLSLEGLAGTKFGTELGAIKDSLGADVEANAINRALVTMGTMGMTKGLGSFLEKGAFKIPGLDKVGDFVKDKIPNIKLNPSTQRLVGEVGQKKGIQALTKGRSGVTKGVGKVAGIPKALHQATQWGGMEGTDSALTRLLASYMIEDKLQKRPSTFDYELPSSLAKPESQRGFGGYI